MTLQTVDAIINNFNVPYNEITHGFITGNFVSQSQSFSALNIIFYLSEWFKLDVKLGIDKLNQIIVSLPFMDMKICTGIFKTISGMLGRSIFKYQSIKNTFCKSLLQSYRNMKYQEEMDTRFRDWSTLEGIYSLSILAKKYYTELQLNNIEIPIDLTDLIELLKRDVSPEVRNQMEE
ncbi:hypothetical protein E4665_17915 [Sporolactobacillus shoreae]|uniref:Uncharacterized protein n=1 Tax=Sporolactobacillus shoreae TaxID=1465501 RepID=A0A4Z0GIC4_9BACL|nr:hypothetical protein [Sporolactobacillus shoreae]TGA95514.1 hypothetical protein E4665_17915 [Sporolactobacillus shoreae]